MNIVERLATTDGVVKARWGVPFDFPSEYPVHHYIGPLKGVQSNGSPTADATEDEPLVIAFEDEYPDGFPKDVYWFGRPTIASELHEFIVGSGD